MTRSRFPDPRSVIESFSKVQSRSVTAESHGRGARSIGLCARYNCAFFFFFFSEINKFILAPTTKQSPSLRAIDRSRRRVEKRRVIDMAGRRCSDARRPSDNSSNNRDRLPRRRRVTMASMVIAAHTSAIEYPEHGEMLEKPP